MAELFEYALVLLASTLVVGFSFSTYSSYASVLGRSTDKAAFSAVLTLAGSAIEHGRSNASLFFDRATVTCAQRTLAFSSPSLNATSSLPVRCDIRSDSLSGEKLVAFDYSNGVLTLRVG